MKKHGEEKFTKLTPFPLSAAPQINELSKTSTTSQPTMKVVRPAIKKVAKKPTRITHISTMLPEMRLARGLKVVDFHPKNKIELKAWGGFTFLVTQKLDAWKKPYFKIGDKVLYLYWVKNAKTLDYKYSVWY